MTFHLTNEGTQSYHRLHNETEIFLDWAVSSRSSSIDYTHQWVLYDPALKKYYLYATSRVNFLDEWNMSKLGWLKSDQNGSIALPQKETLNRYLEVKTMSCGSNQYKVTFHGVQNMTNLDRHGRFCY